MPSGMGGGGRTEPRRRVRVAATSACMHACTTPHVGFARVARVQLACASLKGSEQNCSPLPCRMPACYGVALCTAAVAAGDQPGVLHRLEHGQSLCCWFVSALAWAREPRDPCLVPDADRAVAKGPDLQPEVPSQQGLTQPAAAACCDNIRQPPVPSAQSAHKQKQRGTHTDGLK